MISGHRSDALSGPQRIGKDDASVIAGEFYGAVIPSNLYVPVNSAVVHS